MSADKLQAKPAKNLSLVGLAGFKQDPINVGMVLSIDRPQPAQVDTLHVFI